MRKIPLFLALIFIFSFVSFAEQTPQVLLNNTISNNTNTDELDEVVTVTGVISSIDTPENVIEGITVTIFNTAGEEVGNAVTAADGSYSIGDNDIETGDYDFTVSFDPVGTNGYHDATYEDVTIPLDGIVNLGVYEILPPADFAASGSFSTITLNWTLPANDVEVTLDMIERVQRQVAVSVDEEKLAFYSEKLRYYENLYQRQNSGTDDLSDLVGFVITDEEGVVLETTNATTFTFTFDELVNGQDYSYKIAADYGYGDDYLVFSDVITGRPAEDIYSFTEATYDWFDVRNDANVVTPGLSDDGEVLVAFTTPFEFYGVEYSEVTIGSNGAISFEEDVQIGYEPELLPSADAPLAMIAPYWVDLNPSTSDDHDAFYTFDADGNLWVEWYSIYYDETDVANFEAKLDFENNTILYQYNTAGHWATDAVIGVQDETGEQGCVWPNSNVDDGVAVLLTYELLTYGAIEGTVVDVDDNGIEGVEVFLGEELLATTDAQGDFSAPIVTGDLNIDFVHPDYAPASVDVVINEDQTTTIDDVVMSTYGTIEGTVVDSDDNGIEGVEVKYEDLLLTTTGTDGSFTAMLVGPAGDYDIDFSHADYWPETETATIVLGTPTDMGDITLTAPGAFDVDPTSLEFAIYITPEDTVLNGSDVLTVSNDGSGPVEYHARIEILDVPEHWGVAGNNPNPNNHTIERAFSHSDAVEASPFGPIAARWNETDELWDLIEGWDTDETTGGVGAVVTEDRIYTCEWGYQGNYGFYEYDLDGNLIRTETFPAALQGVRDMAWDGEWLYGGNANANGTIYKFDPDDLSDFELLGTATGCGRGVALDYETGDIYSTNWSALGKLENVGGVYNYVAMTYPTAAGSCYGLAWMPADPDDMNLWFYCQPASNGVIFRVDPENTGNVDAGYEIYSSDQGMAGGIDIYNGYDPYMWNIATNVQADPDHIDIWEGYEAGTPWLFVEPAEGTIEAGGSEDFTVSFNLEGHDLLDVIEAGDEVEAAVVFEGPHWDGGEVPVMIYVVNGASESSNSLPEEYALHQNYPNPFNPATTVKFDLVDAQNVKISVFNVLGQQVAQLVNGRMEAGFHSVSFDASQLSSGVYFYRMETNAYTSMKKMVLVK